MRLLRTSDWPTVERWRDEHFARIGERSARPVTGQRGPGDAVWLVAERNGVPVAAISYTQNTAERVRFVWDLYAAAGHVFSGARLARLIESMCDRDGFELRCKTDPENLEFRQILAARNYEPVAIEYKRTPRGSEALAPFIVEGDVWARATTKKK